MKNSVEKMHVDVGPLRVNNLPVYYFYAPINVMPAGGEAGHRVGI